MSTTLTKPKPASEHGGDLLREARHLRDCGYLVAAVCIARIALEKRLSSRFRNGPPNRKGLVFVAMRLKEHRAITKSQKEATVDAAKMMNRIAHGDPVTDEEAAWLLERTAWVLERVHPYEERGSQWTSNS